MDLDVTELTDMMKVIYKEMAKKEFANSVATMYGNLLASLLKKGFSRTEAMSILLSMDSLKKGVSK